MMHNILLQKAIKNSWKKIAISWPLQNFVASNPLRGFEHLSFEDALKQARILFEQEAVPEQIEYNNRVTIKWLQQFFDQGQAIFSMPHKDQGLYRSWFQLARYDDMMHQYNTESIAWYNGLPESVEKVIEQCLQRLKINIDQYEQFITLMLVTLPGWATYIHYCADWSDQKKYENIRQEYIAMRLVIACMVLSDVQKLLAWGQNTIDVTNTMQIIKESEQVYRKKLLQDLDHRVDSKRSNVNAQFLFCIDPRSEPFRKQIEIIGAYETYSCAGFFFVPAQIEQTDGQTYASCPVLLKPQYTVKQFVECPENDCSTYQKGTELLFLIKEFYRSLKYTFITPFILVEILGPAVGLWVLVSTLLPQISYALYAFAVSSIRKALPIQQSLKDISIKSQSESVETILRSIGLVEHFAKIVVIVGHGSTTRNNAYATSLDCGACGGRQGGNNAQMFAQMANDKDVRVVLKSKGINIPDTTIFVGAQHNTTTDRVELYEYSITDLDLEQIKQDLQQAGYANAKHRMQQWDTKSHYITRSVDWAEVRPEWGLARNASMIIGPRDVTKYIDLQGRAFLHSYNWKYDEDGSLLTLILTAPMIVAQWINMQYLCSTMNNVAYGAGSKTTLNITGKFGVMQGNASDLMHGLSLQSLYRSDDQPYHEMQRLCVIVYAPQERVKKIIHQNNILKNLINNNWIKVICIHEGIVYS